MVKVGHISQIEREVTLTRLGTKYGNVTQKPNLNIPGGDLTHK